MLNVNKITSAMAAAKINKAQLCTKTGIARTTLDAILNGSDARISTIEAIARLGAVWSAVTFLFWRNFFLFRGKMGAVEKIFSKKSFCGDGGLARARVRVFRLLRNKLD